MKIILIFILSFFLLSGCTTTPDVDEPVVELIKPMRFDKETLELCALLDEATVAASFEGVQSAYADVANKYAICAKKQYNSVKVIKEFGNIP